MNTRPLHAPLLAGAIALFASSASAQNAPAERYESEVVAAVRRDLPALRACYENARSEGRSAWRRARAVSLTVNSDGTVGPVSLSPGPGAPGIEGCARPIVQQWRLSAPPNGSPLTLTYSRARVERIARSLRAR